MILIPRVVWLWLTVAVVSGLAGWQYWHSRGQDKKSDADVKQSEIIDALHKLQAEKSSRVDTVISTIFVREKAREAAGQTLKHQADTAGQWAATLADTANMYKLRWQLVGMALDSTTLALGDARERSDSLFADRNRWHLVADSAVASQDRLRADLKIARQGCKIVPLVPCLSRKQTAIVSAVAGAALYARFHR